MLANREVSAFTELEDAKIGILEDHSFNFHDAFASIDTEHNGYLDYENLKKFLVKDFRPPTEDTLIALIRRIDRDDDGRITFEEFAEALSPVTTTLTETVRQKLKPRIITREQYLGHLHTEESKSPRRFLESAENKKVFSSPLRTTAPGSFVRRAEYYASPTAYSATGKLSAKKSKSGHKHTKSHGSHGGKLSSRKKDILNQTHSEEVAQTLREGDWLKDVMRIFREMINMEKEIEVSK
jgi:hypothetical protein